jgi:hypothetical protein
LDADPGRQVDDPLDGPRPPDVGNGLGTGRGQHVDRSEPACQAGGSRRGTERDRLALRCSQVMRWERRIRIVGQHEAEIEHTRLSR